MPKSASQQIFDANKSTVLKAIRDHGPVTRVDLTRITGISAPTMTRLVNSLIQERLVKNTGIGDSSGGRPPMILEFDSDSSFVIGIEWGLTHIKGILSNLDGDILHERDTPHAVSNDIESDLENLKDLIRYLIGSAYITPDRLRGIGIAAAGYINKRTGIIEYSPVQEWHKINIKDPIQDEFKVPVYIDYLSRVMALSEHLYGSARGCDDFIFVTVDYGLGVGIIANGQLVQGYDGYSGEFGHLRVDSLDAYGDRVCVCGKTNCLAEFVSGRGIAKSAKMAKQLMEPGILSQVMGHDEKAITARHVSLAAGYGDKTCRIILGTAGNTLGIKIANISHILNPEIIVLGGKLMLSDYYFNQIENSFNDNALTGVSRKISISRTELQEDSVVKGAVALVLQNILDLQ